MKSPRAKLQLLGRRLRTTYRRAECALRGLVELCDQLAHVMPELKGDFGPRLLDDAWCRQRGVPSELDIRAAAVRLFVAQRAAPTWLESCATYSPFRNPTAHGNTRLAISFTATADITTQEAEEQLRRRYADATRQVELLLRLCAAVPRQLRIVNGAPPRTEAVDDFVQQLIGVTQEDIQVAAYRLGLGHPLVPEQHPHAVAV